jgi:hypothetical protein
LARSDLLAVIIDGVGLVDFLYAYTAAAEYVSGVRILDAPDFPTFNRLVNEQWLPVMGTPDAYTAKGRQFDSIVKHLLGGDLPLRAEEIKQRYLLNLNPRDPGPQRSSEAARHASTTDVRYRIDPGLGLDEAEMNARIRRVTPAPGACSRESNPVFAETSSHGSSGARSRSETTRSPLICRRSAAAGRRYRIRWTGRRSTGEGRAQWS